MAVDAYMYFMDYEGKYLTSESQVTEIKTSPGDIGEVINPFDHALKGPLLIHRQRGQAVRVIRG